MSMPDENEVPSGFRVLEDEEIVMPDDVVLDYMHAEDFAEILIDSPYSKLIGMKAEDARLNQLCFEVYTKG